MNRNILDTPQNIISTDKVSENGAIPANIVR
jgi:hypothetical protein